MFARSFYSKKTSLVSCVFSVLVAISSLASFHVQARVISYATASPPTDTGVNQAVKWWAEEIKKRTDGDFEVEIHYMGSLVKLKDAVDGVSSGIADAASVVPAY